MLGWKNEGEVGGRGAARREMGRVGEKKGEKMIKRDRETER